MSDAFRLGLAFGLSAGVAAAAAPLAWRIAWRTGFLDHPIRYKQHARATPYLGGAAVLVGFLVAAIPFGHMLSIAPALLICALVLFVVGTVDDRIGLGIRPRLTMQVATATALWLAGDGWGLFDADAANLVMTVFWVVGIVNAFNLFDNLDGAAGTVGGVCGLGIAAVALTNNDPLLATVAIALAGSCAGFLPHNLCRPAKIFLGDGGSTLIGILVAGMVMTLPAPATGIAGLLALVPLAGLPILDTTLVVLSRVRRNARVFSGARDHLTHRLLGRLGSVRRVALALGVMQALLSTLALVLDHSNVLVVIAASAAYLALGLVAIVMLEKPAWRPEAAAEGIAGGGHSP